MYRPLSLLSAALFLMAFHSFGQYDGSQPDMTPVTPNEAALFKPLAQPVGNFTGTVPTSIPLFTSGKGTLQMPISLDNSGMALKVEERASSVGLGWNLRAGGMVTRVLRGMPDEYQYGYLASSYKPSNFVSVEGLDTSFQVFQSVVNNQLDLQPDLFYFSCNGLSGRFFFDESGNIRIEDQSGISVVPVFQNVLGQNLIHGWIITDTKGDKFYFGLNKAQNVLMMNPSSVDFTDQNGYTNLPPNVSYNSTWYLVEMDDMNQQNTARFSYDSSEIDFETNVGGYTALQRGNTIDCNPSDLYSDQVFVTTETWEKYLKTIVTPIDSIVISNSGGRTDLSGGMKIDSIRQFDKNGVMQKMIHFNYNYFNDESGTGSDRLELLNISEWGSARADSLAYSFDYFTDFNLPNYLSNAQDYWGYYNGQSMNSSLLPNGTYTFYSVSATEYAFGDRRSYYPACHANMLSTVHYPTGGSRQFTYEANTALYEANSNVTPDPSYFTNDTLNATTWVTFPSNAPQYQAYFDVNSAGGSTAWSYYLDGCCFFGTYTVKILDSASQTVLYTFSNILNETLSLNNGSYEVQFYFPAGNTFYSFNAYWSNLTLPSGGVEEYDKGFYNANMTVGGVRVQQVSDYDPVSGQSVTTKFKYLLYSQDSTLTSGLLISTPLVASQGDCDERAGCQFIRLSANSSYPLNTFAGSYVVYPEVRIYQDGNGYTDQLYSFQFDDVEVDDRFVFPYVPPDFSWARGKLLTENTVDKFGNLLKSTTNIYPEINYPYEPQLPVMMCDSVLGFKMVGYKNTSGMVTDGCFAPYYQTRQFVAPVETDQFNYSASGTQEIVTYYNYYNSINRPFIKNQTVSLGGDLQRIVNYYYSFNTPSTFQIGLTTSEYNMLDTLLGDNYLQPLEQTVQSSRGGTTTLVQAKKTAFGYDGQGKIHISQTKTYNSASDSLMTNFPRYDVAGNLIEEYKNYGNKTDWIFDYNNNLPVAKVVNADSTTIAYTGFESSGTGNWTIGSSSRNTYGVTGTGSYNLGNGSCSKAVPSSSSTYIVSYWSKTGSNYTVSGSTGFTQGKTISVGGSNWTYFEHQVTSVTTVTVSGSGDIDELRLYPKTAQMTTYTYSPLLGLTSTCDIDNRITFFDYDGRGRLKDVKDQDGNIIKTYEYHYVQQP